MRTHVATVLLHNLPHAIPIRVIATQIACVLERGLDTLRPERAADVDVTLVERALKLVRGAPPELARDEHGVVVERAQAVVDVVRVRRAPAVRRQPD